MIDLNGSRTYSTEELKARAMSRLSESGLGLAERLANVERIVYSMLDPKGSPLTDKAQVAAIGAVLVGADKAYEQEKADNAKLVAVLEYEAAEARLAEPVLDNDDYPDERDAKGKFVRHPALIQDDEERAAATATLKAATTATKALATRRKKAHETQPV